ncbi:hypothetical protein TrST_g9648, partial [Triparma strigata]
GLLEGYEDILI